MDRTPVGTIWGDLVANQHPHPQTAGKRQGPITDAMEPCPPTTSGRLEKSDNGLVSDMSDKNPSHQSSPITGRTGRTGRSVSDNQDRIMNAMIANLQSGVRPISSIRVVCVR